MAIDPVSIALVKGISDATGLTNWIAGKFGDSAPVAKAVIDTAVRVSGAKSANDVVDILNRDTAKAAEVKAAIEAQEMQLTQLAYDDLKSARGMYQATGHEQADKIAAHVIRWNAPLVGLLLIAYGASLVVVKDAGVAQAIGTLIGGSVTALWQERQAVMGFFFGSSVGSKIKQQIINGVASR